MFYSGTISMTGKGSTLNKETLLTYILENDSSYLRVDLERYSLTELVILKTGIELKNRKENRKK